MDINSMSKEQLKAALEAANAKLDKQGEPGRIWPDVSKAVKDGEKETGVIVLRGVNANPRQTVNLYLSQFARIITQLDSIVDGVLRPELLSKLSVRSEDERKASIAVLKAYKGKQK